MVHPKPKKPTLEIRAIPFKPSRLSIPPSPFSPRDPLPLSPLPPQPRSKTYPGPDTRYVPPPPLQWLWQCHQCHRTYSLGVTRRCLEDGHEFCAGTTTVKSWRRPVRSVRVKRHKACASEFDYQGWKAWGRWKRSGRRVSVYSSSSSSASSASSSASSSSSSDSDESMNSSSTLISGGGPASPTKDCWNTCDYPSECRWGKRFGVHTPVQLVLPTTFEGIVNAENCKEVRKEKKGEKIDFWGALVASATRRKSVPPSSPLAGVAETPETTNPADVSAKDKDGDVAMGDGDLEIGALQTQPQIAASTIAPSLVMPAVKMSSPVVSLKDIIRKSTKRTTKHPKREKSCVDLKHYEQALEELAPLERVKSKDGERTSTPQMWEVGTAL